MKIQILGTGCAKCKTLTELAETAAKDLGVPYELEKITDIEKIMAFGVLSTPALAIDGQVKSTGRVLSVNDIKSILKRA